MNEMYKVQCTKYNVEHSRGFAAVLAGELRQRATACRMCAALLICTLYIVLCTSCDPSPSAEGLDWDIPADADMPHGFEQQEDVPVYAKKWHMPEGFQGFRERWNARAQKYLADAIETQKKDCGAALTAYLSAVPGSTRHQAAQVRLQSAWHSYAEASQRRRGGDFLVFRRENELPRDLTWQDGQEQPELGSAEARKGGTLRLTLQKSFPNTLRLFGPNSNNATRRYVYDDVDIPLVRLHPLTEAVIPGTADRWAVSEDGRTVYYHLDEKARFSDGTPLTTRDFVTALYVRTSPYAAEPFFEQYYLQNFARITIYGNRYLAVTLAAPRPYAPYYAAIPASCTPFYAEFAADYPTRYQWRVPPTTGGYTVDADGVIKGRKLTMQRVKDWWAVDRKFTRYSCNADNIVYSFIADSSKARELFRIGQVDVMPAREADFWYEGLEIEPLHRGWVQRVHFANIWPRSCFGFHLNCSRPPFHDKYLRRGFHYALNIRLVLDTVFRGDCERSGSYFAGFGKYTDESITALPFSPERARACFAHAGYTEEGADGILQKPDGTRLQVVVCSRIDAQFAACMNILREEAARCGLDLRMEQLDDTVFYQRVREKKHTAALYSWGFSPPLPDASPFFLSRYAYKEDGTPLPGTSNITATNSPTLDRAILDCRLAATEEKAVEANHRVQQLIAATGAWVPGWTAQYQRFAQWRWVRWPNTPECRFCPPRYYDPLDSHLYWIDEDMKAETLKARAKGESFPEENIAVPLPDAT